MTRAVMALVVIGGLLASAEAVAQGEEWEDPGLWIAAGGGYGLATTDCVLCSDGSRGSFVVLLGIGGSASRTVRFGIEGVGWFQSSADTSREYFGVMAVAQWFPVRTIPLSVQLGIGGGRYAQEGGGDVLDASGFNVLLAANYDYYITRNIAVRPFARYLISPPMTTKVNQVALFTDLTFGLLYFGVALTWVKL